MNRTAAAIVLVITWASFATSAQSPLQVSGVVKDGSGGVVADATVEVVVVDRAIAAVQTSTDGRFIATIPPGAPYQLRARRDGFADALIAMPAATATVSQDIVLRVGTVSDTVVVTASRNAESRSSVTESVSVLTAADIAALGSPSLSEAIRFVPGLAIEGTGREGALSSLFSRGGESDYNLVLIDGVRVNLDGGQFDFSRISGGEIERVEIVRGAQSSLWGSDAMGAVVQVFTRRGGVNAPPRLTGSFEGGSFGSARSDARLTGGGFGVVDYYAGMSHRITDGAFADRIPESDRYEQTAFDGGVGVLLGTRASLRSTLRNSRASGRSVGPISYGARDSGGVYLTKDRSWTLSANHTIGSRYSGYAQVNYFRYRNESSDLFADPQTFTYAILEGTPNALYPNGVRLVRLISAAEFGALSAAGATPGPGQFLASRTATDSRFTSARAFERPAVRYQGDLNWAQGQRLSLGYEWERERNPLVAVQDLQNTAFFVQQRASVGDRWFVTAGVRVDNKDTYDTFASPKLSTGGFLVPLRAGGLSSLKVSGNIGKGIKSPTFGERYGGSFADPDPNLRVERAVTRDLGLEATFADQRFRGSVTYFNNSYTDQVAFRSGVAGDGIPEYINIDGSAARGWELDAALQRPAGGVTVSANYSYVDTEVVTNVSTSQQFQPGQPLLRRPRHSGTVRAGYVNGRLAVDVNARFVGDRHDNSFLSLRTIANTQYPTPFTTDITVNPGYVLLGLGGSVRAHEALTLFFRLDNLTDRTWDSALGYPGLPRAAVVGARFNIGRQ